ncbi:hypothetical protein OHA72_05160 [Dactylosporangium sp. NBC_01737]|uniref:hypothetical protein n=1 Tax=Dactylosporangium sp. NBC_01737 TaxID=2975959 RepID=UPI002E12C1AF|nr:hypothetical protein OHA72_05160 [Dactylosporangium sp. NBC_01737]
MDGRLVALGIAIVFVLVAAAGTVVWRRRAAARQLSREEVLSRARLAGRQMTIQSRTARRGGRRGTTSDGSNDTYYGSVSDSGGMP